MRSRSHRSKKIKVRLSLEGVGWGILVFFAKETVQRDELITFPEEKLLAYPLSLKFGLMTSPVFQTSGFPIVTIIWLEKMVTMKTVYGRIKALRVFACLLIGMWRI